MLSLISFFHFLTVLITLQTNKQTKQRNKQTKVGSSACILAYFVGKPVGVAPFPPLLHPALAIGSHFPQTNISPSQGDDMA